MANTLIAISFLSSALAYAALALMLRPSRYGQGAPRLRLRLAALATAVWALAAWWVSRLPGLSAEVTNLVDLTLVAVWLWQLASFARWQSQPLWLQGSLQWAGGAVVALAVLGLTPAFDATLGGLTARYLPFAGLVLTALGLVALEQIYRNASSVALPAIRWFVLGVGGIFTTELAGFADVVLLGGVAFEPWVARSLLLALCALALAHAARRMPDWSMGLSISRRAAFYTSSFVAIGVYLLLLSVGGWWLMRMPPEFARVGQPVFWVLGVAGLVAMLFSEALRRRLRVFIAANFYPHRYDYRLEWLRFTSTLSQSDGEDTVQQRAIRALAQIVESPFGVLWRRDPDSHMFELASAWPAMPPGLRSAPIPAEDSLPDFLRRQGWLVDLRELRDDPRLYGDLALDTDAYARDRDALIVPLMQGDSLYGWVVLDRPQKLALMTFEDRDLLKTAGRQVAVHLAQFDVDARLAQARQFETFSRTTAFLMHDLKNVAAQLKLISQNAERHKRNPEFIDDAMRTIGSSAARMGRLISQLSGGAEPHAVSVGTMQSLDLASVAERAAVRCASFSPVPRVVTLQKAVVFADGERLAAVVEHSIRNAQDATPPDGDVRLEIDRIGPNPVLRIVDSGAGMDEQFIRERLFRPFDTTKGSRGMGIGAFQVREYLRGLGGNVEVKSVVGAGTTISLVFPAQLTDALSRRAG